MQSEVLKSVLLPWSDQLVPSWVFYVLFKAVFPRAWEPCQGWTPGVPGTTTLTAGGLSCSPAPSLALDRLSVCLSRAGKLSQVSPFPGTHCAHPPQMGPPGETAASGPGCARAGSGRATRVGCQPGERLNPNPAAPRPHWGQNWAWEGGKRLVGPSELAAGSGSQDLEVAGSGACPAWAPSAWRVLCCSTDFTP